MPCRLVKRIELNEDQCFWDTILCLLVPNTEFTVKARLFHFTEHETLKGDEE